VKSAVILMNILYSVTLKFIGLFCTLNGFLPMCVIIISCNSRVENIYTLSYTDLSNVDTFHCIIIFKYH
jgi:hypothetical protein